MITVGWERRKKFFAPTNITFYFLTSLAKKKPRHLEISGDVRMYPDSSQKGHHLGRGF